MKKLCFCLLGLIIFFTEYIGVYANAGANVQTYVDEEQVLVYIPTNYEQIEEVFAQIGQKSVDTVEIKNVNDVNDCYIETTILFDNSLSISAKNRDKMKGVAKGLVQNHAEGEMFSLATFDTEIRELSVDSVDYDTLQKQIDDIEFVNQDTYLNNILYEVFSNSDSSSKAYQNIVILSDGSDDNDVGYTYDEMSALLNDKKFQLYSIGSRYEGNVHALEDMFALSRAAGSQFFLLDELEDTNGIVEQIKANNPKKVVCFNIPDEVKDGSEHNIMISLRVDGELHQIVTKARMPFINIENKEVVEEVEEEQILPIDTETEETQDKINVGEKGNRTLRIIFIVVLIYVLLCMVGVLVYLIMKKKGKNKQLSDNCLSESQVSEVDENDDATILMQEDDEATILMKVEDISNKSNSAKIIVLIEEHDRSNVLQCECYTQVIVGRNENCDIVIQGDKSVSGKHCVISVGYEGGLSIRDNASSNGTYLNGTKLSEEKTLRIGDVLEIGRKRYEVDIIGE